MEREDHFDLSQYSSSRLVNVDVLTLTHFCNNNINSKLNELIMTHQGQSPCGSLNSLPTDWARHSFIRYTIGGLNYMATVMMMI